MGVWETRKCCSECKVILLTTDSSSEFRQAPAQLLPLLATLIKSRPKVQAGQRPNLPENKCLACSNCSASVCCLAKANSQGLRGRRKKGYQWNGRVHRGAWKPNPTWLPFSLAVRFQCIPLGGKYTGSNSPPVSRACTCSLRVSKHTDFRLKQSHSRQVSLIVIRKK